MSGRILLIDDDSGVRQALAVTLGTSGFDVVQACSGEEGLRKCEGSSLDLILLDINLPGMSGRSVCRELRRRGCDTPVVMLTVRAAEQEKVDAFTMGADDYITKPFGVGELTARILALLRRSRKETTQADCSSPALKLREDELLVIVRGKRVRFTPTQFRVLDRLQKAGGKTVPHHVLLASVWGPAYRDRTEYLRVFIRQLRVLLEQDPTKPAVIQTVQHIGYRLCSETSEEAA